MRSFLAFYQVSPSTYRVMWSDTRLMFTTACIPKDVPSYFLSQPEMTDTELSLFVDQMIEELNQPQEILTDE